MHARLHHDKLEAAINLVKSFSRRKKVTLWELHSLIGTLNFACEVSVPLRPFLRRLIDLTMGIVKPHFHVYFIFMYVWGKRHTLIWLLGPYFWRILMGHHSILMISGFLQKR